MYCGGTFALSVITFNALDFGSRGLGSSPDRVTALSYNSNSAALHLGLQMGTSRLWGKRHQEWVQQSQTSIPKMQIFTLISNKLRYVLGQVTLRYFIMSGYIRPCVQQEVKNAHGSDEEGNSVLNLWL